MLTFTTPLAPPTAWFPPMPAWGTAMLSTMSDRQSRLDTLLVETGDDVDGDVEGGVKRNGERAEWW